jgi:hypothetical protein
MDPTKVIRKLSGMVAGLLVAGATAGGGVILQTGTASAVTPPPLFTQCPALGWDTGCQLLITINANGTTTVTTDPNQGPYDGVEDSLIGVLNNSSFGVSSMDLAGAGAPLTGPFNFDSDGLCSNVDSSFPPGTPPPPATNGVTTFQSPPSGCPFGPTGYEGPNTGFTNYSPATGCATCTGNTGTVKFTATHGLVAGGSAYFSLEGKVAATIVATIDPTITAKGVTFSTKEGALFNGTVATFTDPDTSAMASEYSASINWGDLTTTAGTIGGGSGSFTVTGMHTYAEEQSAAYAVTVTITDNDNTANSDVAHSSANVGDAALSSTCPTPVTNSTAPPVSPLVFAGATANLHDNNAAAPSSDFTATIDWGDFSSSSGTVSGAGGDYVVSGTHTYASSGTYTVTTAVTDDGGSKTSVSCSLIVFVFATASGAAFVIGDLEAPLPTFGIGNHVTWWSSQWAKLNPMSGGPPPSSMKGFAGFEDNPLSIPPKCGDTWTTDTGNATPPPATVFPVMGVLVSSTVTQTGSVVSGDIKEIVIVENDPGYAPNPGSSGTGKIIGFVC